MGRMRLFVRSARCKPSHPWESGAGKLLASPRLVLQCPSVHFFFGVFQRVPLAVSALQSARLWASPGASEPFG